MTDLEKTLADNIRNGDIKSFELVFKSYYTRLCKYAKSWVHDYDASADIIKDIFIKWWENHETININTSISAYLYKSAHNGCINYIHRVLKNKNKTLINESDLTESLSELNNQQSSDYPMAHLAIQELKEAIEKSINTLPDQCREIFILSRIKQKSHHEIAIKLGISPNTVKVQIYRALLKLKKDLKEYMPFLLLFSINQYYQIIDNISLFLLKS